MAKLRRIDVFSFVKLHALLGGLFGLVLGIIYSIGGFFVDLFVSFGWASSIYWETPGLSYGTVLAFGALVGMPLIFACFGAVIGFIGAILYNVFARYTGGIEIDMFKKDKKR